MLDNISNFNSDIETLYLLKDKKWTNKYDNNVFIKFSETLKYRITSKYLKRNFEIFRIDNTEFFSYVAKFHLPCIRSYYNGSNCYLLPSAITAYHTLTNIDFKYFLGTQNPIEIIDKYRQRGYGTILNKIEIIQYLLHIISNEHLRKAYNISNINEIINIIGYLDINHTFFKPRRYRYDEFTNINLDYVEVKTNSLNKEDIIQNYISEYKYFNELVEKRTIASDGHIEQFKCWIIEASYDLFNNF